MLLLTPKNLYSSTTIGNIRCLYNLKLCFKKHLSFLKYKQSFSKALSNRVVKRSNYMRSYKDINYFYILYLRSNISNNIYRKNFIRKFFSKDVSVFLYAYKQYTCLNDLNRVLLWRLVQLDSMFKLRTSIVRRKKKIFYTNRITFIKPKYRILISWTWLKFFIKSFSEKNNLNTIHLALENFLTAKEDKHVLTNIKYSVYKLQLLRSL